MIVAVASGKGGTGKTSLTVNLALSLSRVQVLDCDVEEPNAHILLKPDQVKTEPVYTAVPKVNEALCTYCGDCSKFCRYNALLTLKDKILVFPELCHSCGGCTLVCPQKAIQEEKHQIGTLNYAQKGDLTLVWGELTVGKPLAVPIIKKVKNQTDSTCTVLLDSPPGTSCSFVETVSDCDFCILVTEPTPFGLYDLQIAVEVLKKIGVPFGVVINRAGIGDHKVYDYCKNQNIPILLEIPYDRRIAELYSKGIPFSKELHEWTNKFKMLHKKIEESLQH